MRKPILLMTLILVLSFAGAACPAELKVPVQKGAVAQGVSPVDVALRFSKYEGFSRIVFEAADEAFIASTAVSTERNQVKVLFPSNINLRVQGNPDMETSLKGALYSITVQGPFRTKVLKLSSPPRLSLDIVSVSKDEGRKPATPEAVNPAVGFAGRVVVDPGHGGYDMGIVSGDSREKDITFSVARHIESALLKKNRAVFLTRRADQYLSITDRAVFANQKAPDVFISIHLTMTDTFVIYTSAAEPATQEVAGELYSLSSRQRRFTEKSRTLAEGLGALLKEEFKRDIIFRKMDIPLLSSMGAAAVMVELPFTVASDPSMKAKTAEILLKGIASYGAQ